MNVLFLLVPLALVLGAGFAFAFVWAVRDGQMDDLDDPPQRMLAEDALRREGSGRRRPDPSLASADRGRDAQPS
jgi:cbb3-type cytochrome oxidase maturation protein